MAEKKTLSADLQTLDAKIPWIAGVPYGIQHVLAMFVANLAPIAIVAAASGIQDATMLIQSAMLIAGIGTLIQLFPVWRIGSGLPIVMGVSFTFVSAMCSVGATMGYGYALGAVIVGGCFEGVLGLLTKYWIRIVTPIVAACVVTSIGFSLLSVGATSFGGGSGAEDFGAWYNLLLGTVSLVACLAFQMFAPKGIRQLSVLFGLIIGYIVAIPLGVVDFSGFSNLHLLSLPAIAFLDPALTPQFAVGPIITVAIIFLVSATETIGDTSALAISGLHRQVTKKELSGSIACDGFISALGGCLGSTPITSFSQNVGLIGLTGVVNRRAIATGAIILVAAAFVPAVAAVFNSLPDAVLGGCTIMMFGNIVVAGFQMMERAGFTHRNLTIAALSLSIGIGFTQVSDIFVNTPQLFQDVFAANCVAGVFVVAIIANLILPQDSAPVVEAAQAAARAGAQIRDVEQGAAATASNAVQETPAATTKQAADASADTASASDDATGNA